MTKQAENNPQGTANIADDRVLATVMADRFIKWKSKLHSEMRGGKLMFNVPRYYKWIEEKDLLTYFIDNVYYCC